MLWLGQRGLGQFCVGPMEWTVSSTCNGPAISYTVIVSLELTQLGCLGRSIQYRCTEGSRGLTDLRRVLILLIHQHVNGSFGPSQAGAAWTPGSVLRTFEHDGHGSGCFLPPSLRAVRLLTLLLSLSFFFFWLLHRGQSKHNCGTMMT